MNASYCQKCDRTTPTTLLPLSSGHIGNLCAECHTLADATLRLDACRAQLDCDDFREGDHGGKCDDEQEALEDAIEDTDNFQECGTLD